MSKIELHSIRAKLMINFYLIFTLAALTFLISYFYKLIFSDIAPNYLILFVWFLMLIISVGMYAYSFLGYLDREQKVLVLKKTFFKKEWIIKLEDILTVEKEKLFIARGKHIKVTTYNKDKSDTNSYYILSSRLGTFLGSDDADYLWKEVLKRKKEVNDIV